MQDQPINNRNDEAQSLAAGDVESFNGIYNKFYLSIFYYAKKFIVDAELAKDITAESFIKLWQQAEKNELVNNAKAFLHVTTKNACRDALRSRHVRQEKAKEIAYLEQEETRVAWNVAELEASVMEWLRNEIDKLPEPDNSIFKLFLEGLKTSEIAARLGLSEQTVMNRKSMALKRLRLRLRLSGEQQVLLAILLSQL